MNMFEKAIRTKLRFPSPVGQLTVEDLYDLPLTSTKGPSLDDTARRIYKTVKESDEMSFVDESSSKASDSEFALEIVKHIIAVRKEENRVTREASERKIKKERIAQILAEKENDDLKNKSTDELRELLNQL